MFLQRGVKNIYHIGAAIETTQTILLDAYADYYIYDTFTDDDAVTLPNHTPDKDTVGNGWVADGGTFTITSNKVSGGANGNRVVIDSGQADICAQQLSTVPASGAPGLIWRWSSATAHWLSQLVQVAEVDLYRMNGTYARLAGSAMTFTAGETYTHKIDVGSDNSFEISVNGTVKITSTQTFNEAATSVGIRTGGGGSNEIFDNFSCEAAS